MFLNLFVVLILTFMIAGVLVYFISAHDKHRQKQQAQILKDNPDESDLHVDFRQFTKICMDILEHIKLEVEDVKQLGNDELIIRAVSNNPVTKVQFLVAGFHINPKATLDNQRITEISEQIISERLSKALIMTTGQVDPSIYNYTELAPIEFLDGEKLKELIQKYTINY